MVSQPLMEEVGNFLGDLLCHVQDGVLGRHFISDMDWGGMVSMRQRGFSTVRPITSNSPSKGYITFFCVQLAASEHSSSTGPWLYPIFPDLQPRGCHRTRSTPGAFAGLPGAAEVARLRPRRLPARGARGPVGRCVVSRGLGAPQRSYTPEN